MVLGLPTEFVASRPEILAYTDGELATDPEDWRRYVDQDRRTFARRFAAAAADADVFVDLASCVCDDVRCRMLTEDGEPMAYDYAHFTLAAAREVAACVRQRYGTFEARAQAPVPLDPARIRKSRLDPTIEASSE